MTLSQIPQVGMIGLTTVGGGTGKFIKAAQAFNGDGFENWEHAFILLPDNMILEAEPGGALIRELHYSDVYWCTNIYKLLPQPVPSDLTTDLYFNSVASGFKGTPYSFLDYAALLAHHLHVPVPGLKHFIQTSRHEICSQMCDDFYWRIGVQIFTDNRWPGYVTPGSLFRRDLELR